MPAAYFRVVPSAPCGWLCSGNTSERLVDTYSAYATVRERSRAARGYSHVLKPLGCRFHWFDEARPRGPDARTYGRMMMMMTDADRGS